MFIGKKAKFEAGFLFFTCSEMAEQDNKRYMDVSKNRGTPKSSILIGLSIINHPFWGTHIFGNTHIYIYYIYIYKTSSKFCFRRILEVKSTIKK